jgi:hypothetical protein
MHDLECAGRDCGQPDQLDADDGRECDVAESEDSGGDHHDAKQRADPEWRRTQSFDAGLAVIDCHAMLLISVMIGTLGMVSSHPQRRHPTKP